MGDIQVKGSNSLLEQRQTVELPGTLMDWVLTSEGLSEDEELATAVRVALGTDRLSDPAEALPDPDSTNRRGWWGDYEAEEIWDGWPIGTKAWLLLRAKIADRFSAEGDTVTRAEIYTYEALQAFVERRICSHIVVKAQRINRQQIDVYIIMYRGPLPAIELRYAYLWSQVVSE